MVRSEMPASSKWVLDDCGQLEPHFSIECREPGASEAPGNWRNGRTRATGDARAVGCDAQPEQPREVRRAYDRTFVGRAVLPAWLPARAVREAVWCPKRIPQRPPWPILRALQRSRGSLGAPNQKDGHSDIGMLPCERERHVERCGPGSGPRPPADGRSPQAGDGVPDE
jgi:hypothetical protein